MPVFMCVCVVCVYLACNRGLAAFAIGIHGFRVHVCHVSMCMCVRNFACMRRHLWVSIGGCVLHAAALAIAPCAGGVLPRQPVVHAGHAVLLCHRAGADRHRCGGAHVQLVAPQRPHDDRVQHRPGNHLPLCGVPGRQLWRGVLLVRRIPFCRVASLSRLVRCCL